MLLIQFRDDPKVQEWEYNSFLKYMKLQQEQLGTVNALHEPLAASLLEGVHGLIVAGTGSERVGKPQPFHNGVKLLLRHAYENDIPTFAVCFGAQLTALEFGGNVETRPEMKETGTRSVQTTDHAKEDPLFCMLPTNFNAQMGHNDTVTVLPQHTIRLAYNDRVENQAFRFQDKPFYSVQFHPELDHEEIRFRFNYYRDEFATSPDEYEQIMNSIAPSEDAAHLLERFIDKVVCS